MDVTVIHLQSTGIGRTVNMLRKDYGEVGSLAKSLIARWKQMVASESSDHSGGNHSENDQNSYEQEETVDSSQKSQRHHEHSSSSKHKSGGHREHSKHHSQNSHHRDRKNVADENGEKSTKRRRRSSHDSDRNGHKSSSHHKDSRHRKNENNHDEPNANKHHKRSNETDSVSSTSSSHKRHHEHESEQSSSSKRIKCDSTTSPSSQRNTEKKSSKSKPKPVDDGIEIDHSTGTSFGDALGMIEPLPKIKSSLSSSGVNSHKSFQSKSSNQSALSSSSGKEKTSSSSSSSLTSHEKKERHKERSKPSTSSSNMSNTPTLLTTKAKLPPLDDLLKDLPPPVECVIRNDYKPLPVNAMVMDCVYRPNNSKLSSANEEAALCASTTSKNQRTKVYSGTKTGQLLSVPSLHELCIRFLQKNIDALEYTGGVPFEILRPVLERASPNQLFTFEHFNPYLMEDSDALWQQHCKNKFRAYKRQEMETWREMYTRCEKEQEERLASLANNIKKSISVAVPVRQTKLAYVDSAVKPPRGIVKKQNQFGTHAKLVATPAARVDALSSVATNMARVGDARLRTSAAIRDTAQAQTSNGALKPKKAPLMMKTLQLMKGRFKR